jgi:putative membrane protein
MSRMPPPRAPDHAGPADEPRDVPPADLDQARRTSMAAERTWLAWWRTALAASAGALAVGRFAPELLPGDAWPYVLLGCAYAALAIGLLIIGALRQRELEHAMRTGEHRPLSFRAVGVFTIGGIVLALTTVVLVIAQT